MNCKIRKNSPTKANCFSQPIRLNVVFSRLVIRIVTSPDSVNFRTSSSNFLSKSLISHLFSFLKPAFSSILNLTSTELRAVAL